MTDTISNRPAWDEGEPDVALVSLGPHYARLVSLALPDDDALAALSALTDQVLAAQRARPAGVLQARRRQAGNLHQSAARHARDARLDKLVGDMATASVAVRAILVGEALVLHPPAAERRAIRKSAIRTLYRIHYKGMPVRQAARRIAADLAHRQGEHIRSTGSIGKDQLCDRIVLTGLPTSAETIRQSL